MAKVCYITNNRIEKEYLEIKDGAEKVKNTATSFALYEMYDELEIEEIENELADKRKGERTRLTVSVLDTILAVKRVRLDKKEYLKIIVYEDKNMQAIRDVFYADTLSVKETVTEVVKMGIGLIRSDVKDLVNIIEKAYRQLDIVDDDEDYGRTCWLKEIAKMCMQEIENSVKIKEEKQTKGSKDSIKFEIDKDGKEAYIRVTEFTKWYNETDYKFKLSVYTVREDFKNAGITICNPGRTDYNRTVEGRVVEFDIDKLKSYCD